MRCLKRPCLAMFISTFGEFLHSTKVSPWLAMFISKNLGVFDVTIGLIETAAQPKDVAQYENLCIHYLWTRLPSLIPTTFLFFQCGNSHVIRIPSSKLEIIWNHVVAFHSPCFPSCPIQVSMDHFHSGCDSPIASPAALSRRAPGLVNMGWAIYASTDSGQAPYKHRLTAARWAIQNDGYESENAENL